MEEKVITPEVAKVAIDFLRGEVKKLKKADYFFAAIIDEKENVLSFYCPKTCLPGCCDVTRAINSALVALRFSPKMKNEEIDTGIHIWLPIWEGEQKTGAVAIIGFGPQINRTLTVKTKMFLETN